MLIRHNYRSILCLNGTLPERSFFSDDLPVIAADGAANFLMDMGVTPEIVIGDLDSVHPHHLAHLKHHRHEDQNFSDFQKTLFFLEKNDLLPAIVVGVNGGYLDHVLNNINLFMNTRNILYAPPIVGFCLSAGEERKLVLPMNTKMSLFGIPTATVTSTGLKWELSRYELAFPGATSCFNRTVLDEVTIHVDAGNVLMLIYEQQNTA